MGVINVPLQAIATMLLVRTRGSVWATVGGSMMWVGIAMQATGVAGWASAYFYATDPGLERPIGSAVVEAANNDQAHLFAFLIPGALLVVLGELFVETRCCRSVHRKSTKRSPAPGRRRRWPRRPC